MFCRKCGKEIPGDSDFCPLCGASTTPGSPAAPPPDKSPVETVTNNKKPPLTRGRDTQDRVVNGGIPPVPSSRSFPPYPGIAIIIWTALVLIGAGAVAWWPVGWNILSPLLWIIAVLLILSALVEGIPRKLLGLFALLGSLWLLYGIITPAIAQNTTYWGNVSYYGWEVDTPFLAIAVAGVIVLLVLSCKRLFGKQGSLLRKFSSGTSKSSAVAPGNKRLKALVPGVIAVILACIFIGFPLVSSLAVPAGPGVVTDLPGVDSSAQQYTVTATMTPTAPPVTSYPVTQTATPARTVVVSTTRSTSSPPDARFSASTLSGNAPLKVSFSDESTGFPSVWTWDFGDGTSGSVQNPVHTYTTGGTYFVRLSVTGPGGRSTSTSQQVTVYSTSPASLEAMFSADPSTGVAPLTVTFTDTSSGAPSDRSWDFGDGSTSTLANPVHTYMTPGQYTARLTVRSSSGISRTAFSPIMVTQASAPAVTTTAPTPVHTTDDIYGTISPVTAGFTYTPDLGPVPLIVSFKDTSTGSPTTWNWNFGDGTTSNQKNPVHTYSSPGDYFVELSVTGSNGASKVKLGPVSVFYKI